MRMIKHVNDPREIKITLSPRVIEVLALDDPLMQKERGITIEYPANKKTIILTMTVQEAWVLYDDLLDRADPDGQWDQPGWFRTVAKKNAPKVKAALDAFPTK